MYERLSEYVSLNFTRLARDVRTQNDDRLCPQQRLRFKQQSSFKIAESRESSESFQKKRRYGSETESSSILCAVLRQQIALSSEREACYVRMHVFRHADLMGVGQKYSNRFLCQRNAVIIYLHFRLVLFIVVPTFFFL